MKTTKRDITATILDNLDIALGKHLTHDELSKRTGISRSTITMWYSGSRSINIEHLNIISETFHISVSLLMHGISPENYSIHDELGLSEGSIQLLKETKDKVLLSFLINSFLSKDNIGLLLFGAKWIDMKFTDINDELDAFYSVANYDKGFFKRMLMEDDEVYRNIEYKNLKSSISLLFCEFLDKASINYNFGGTGEEYERYRKEMKERGDGFYQRFKEYVKDWELDESKNQ